MADLEFSGIGVVAASGSVGNTTFTFNAFGQYAKARGGLPAGGPNLAAWQVHIGDYTGKWQSAISEAQREAWGQYAFLHKDALTHTNRIRGFYAWMSVQLARNMFGLGLLSDPPIGAVPPEVIVLRSATPDLVISGDATTRATCYIYAARPLPAGRMSSNQIYAFMKVVDNGSASFSEDITTEYSARFPSYVAGSGQKVWVKVVPVSPDNGLRNVPVFTSRFP